jgi:hypothetical protein
MNTSQASRGGRRIKIRRLFWSSFFVPFAGLENHFVIENAEDSDAACRGEFENETAKLKKEL